MPGITCDFGAFIQPITFVICGRDGDVILGGGGGRADRMLFRKDSKHLDLRCRDK
jgi:hypothetical protein